MTAIADRRPTLAANGIGAGRKLKNHLATGLAVGSFLVALVPLVWLLWTVVGKGWHVLANAGWWTRNQRSLVYTDPGGGAYHAILGTIEQVGLTSVISIPVGLLVAIYLVEYGRGPFARVTTFMVDILTGVPSIVAAVFVYSLLIVTLGGQKAGWLVSMALVMLMIPVIVRTTEEMLRLVPDELREAAYALGVPKWRTIVRVVLPTAMNGILTGIVLGIARVAGETAPLLVLVNYNPSTNNSLFNGPQGALTTMIADNFHYYSSSQTFAIVNNKSVPVHNYAVDRVWGAALTLVLFVMLLNLIARLIGRYKKIPD
jgi:phosphate transport system permease protein